jgi:hypothetical protein
MKTPALLAALAALLLSTALAACGDDASTDADAAEVHDASLIDAAPIAMRGACPFDNRVGLFEISQRMLYAAVTGQVAAGVVPNSIFEPLESEGSCQMLRRQNPFCDPGCDTTEVCDFDGNCLPYPRNLNAGTVTVTGLLAEVEMEPNVVNTYQNTSVPNPPFEADSLLTLTATGDEVDAFTLYGYGVPTLVVTDDTWTMTDATDLEIHWTGAESEGRIFASFNVDQHGNTPVTLVCDLDDTGTATVPASMVSLLLDYGVTGAATGNLYRQTTDYVDLDEGCVELDVYSHIQVPLSVAAD